MSRLSILTDSEKVEFDCPPSLSSDTKPLYFSATKELQNKIGALRTPTNKAGFLLQYGYFKACKRFFVSAKFHQEDIEYAATKLGISLRSINLSQYKKKVPIDHRAIILKLLDYRPFDETARQWVEKEIAQQVKQLTNRNKMYLYLIAFVQHQFCLRQDTCVDILLKCVQSFKNSATKHLNKSDQLTKGERRAAVKHISTSNRCSSNLIDEIAKIARSPVLSDSGKVKEINNLLNEYEKQKFDVAQEKITSFEKSLDHIIDDKDYFDMLEKLSLKLQRRVAGIAKALIFNDASSNKNLIAAITDTHGYTELIFAATHLLGISFAPRLKGIGKQSIYAFSSGKTYEKSGYKILPSRTINQKLIEKYWDDILRFIATIKLKRENIVIETGVTNETFRRICQTNHH